VIWFVLAALIILSFGLVVAFGAPWLPTRNNDIKKLLKLSGLKSGDVFIDLGCGSGGVLVAASQMGAKPIGYEINPIVTIAVASVKICKCRRLRIFDHALHVATRAKSQGRNEAWQPADQLRLRTAKH